MNHHDHTKNTPGAVARSSSWDNISSNPTVVFRISVYDMAYFHFTVNGSVTV